MVTRIVQGREVEFDFGLRGEKAVENVIARNLDGRLKSEPMLCSLYCCYGVSDDLP